MELEDLKTQLNRRLEGPVGAGLPDLDGRPPRSHSMLLRLRRNLWIEFGLYVAALCLIAIQAHRHPSTAIRIFNITAAVCMVALMVKLRQVIRRIDEHLRSGPSVRDHLASLLDILQAYSRKYLYLSVGFALFFTIYMILLEYLFPTQMQGAVPPSGTAEVPVWVFVAVAFVLTLLFTGLIYLLARAYIWWMFGKHIRRLREALQHFDQGPED